MFAWFEGFRRRRVREALVFHSHSVLAGSAGKTQLAVEWFVPVRLDDEPSGSDPQRTADDCSGQGLRPHGGGANGAQDSRSVVLLKRFGRGNANIPSRDDRDLKIYTTSRGGDLQVSIIP